MTVREHLKKAHAIHADHHRKMAKIHLAAMAKATDSHHEFHKAAAAHHEAAAEEHEQMVEECTKAADTGNLGKRGDGELETTIMRVFSKFFGDTLVPIPGLSRVAPNHPGFTAVPRAGQPAPVAKNVPLEFSKLVVVDEDSLSDASA
jgi:hypothetical protein